MDALELARQQAEAADRGEAPPPAPGPDAGAQGEPGAVPAAQVDESKQWIDAALYYGDAVRAMLPDNASKHWTDERLRKLGEALARCAVHYGWKFGAVTHPLAQLAVAGAPLVWPIAAPYVMPKIAELMKGRAPAVNAPAATEPTPPPSSPMPGGGEGRSLVN